MKKNIFLNYSKEDLLKSFFLSQIYLDQYFLKNKWIGLINVIFFFIFSIGIFLYFRFLFIGKSTFLEKQNEEYFFQNHFNNLYYYIGIYFLIILYFFLIKFLFKKNINVFYIYLSQWDIFHRFNWFLSKLSIIRTIIGKFYVLFFRLGELSYRPNLYVEGVLTDSIEGGRLYYICMDESMYKIKNDKLIEFSLHLLELAKKYKNLQKLFQLMASWFRILFFHYNYFTAVFPLYLLLIIFLNDIFSNEIKYFYIFSFYIFILKIYQNYIKFIKKKRQYLDDILANYFYKNNISYIRQRSYFLQDDKENNVFMYFKSDQNSKVELEKEEILDYSLSNFESNVWEHVLDFEKNFGKISSRFCLIIVVFYLYCNILLKNENYYITICNNINISFFLITSLLGILLFFILIKLNNNIYYQNEYWPNIDDHTDTDFVRNRKNKIIFWLLISIILYLLYFFYKSSIFIPNSEVLIENFFFRIEKIFTYEEKIAFIYNYFDITVVTSLLTLEEQDYLRFLLRQIEFVNYKDNLLQNSLKDLQVFVKIFIDNYSLSKDFNEKLALLYLDNYEDPNNKYPKNFLDLSKFF